MESSTQSHSIENDNPCHARTAVVCLPEGRRNLGPRKARLSDTVSPWFPATRRLRVGTNDVESRQPEEGEHVQRRFGKAVLNAVQQPLDVLEDEWFGVEQVGLRESMAEQPPSLTVQRFFSETKNAQWRLAHGLVDGCLGKICLLAVHLLDRVNVGEGHLVWTDPDGGSMLLVQFVDGQGAIA